ncbi:GyrI-like domain-containing protein [Tessaracoccus sp. HDW20]|uniref:GyrI-like domain-containing protein n=1 Tax=Tessaracoccus coleopterorum TaxID=2714950 RepID=UPI0018D2DADE|nr:GyrI-like domain-containing protein [Tessaracoccus coleopterorum]NHB85437.1 GyrI-like domain-containing protein [Tessaracoccus coleopterorum]
MSSFPAGSEGWPEPIVLEGVPATPTAVVRHEDVTLTDLPALFDAGYQRVVAVTVALDIPITGPAVAVYVGDPHEVFTVEIGFPVAGAFSPADGVRPSSIPGGSLAVLSHIGPYDALPAAWARLTAFLADQGLRPGDRVGEVYVTEPSPRPTPPRCGPICS